MPALGAGAFRALDAPALALEFCELPFQLLEGIALILQLRAQDALACLAVQKYVDAEWRRLRGPEGIQMLYPNFRF